MTIVIDASVVTAMVADAGEAGQWAAGICMSDLLAAPHLLGVEVASALRRQVASGRLGADVAALALADAAVLPVRRYPFEPFSERVWELRDNLSSYDAWYVALAEELGGPLATLDARLAAAPALACEVITPAS